MGSIIRSAVLASAAIVLATATIWSAAQPAATAPSAAAVEFFELNIRPVLAESCFDCHTDTQTSGLRVDSREALLKGGDSGPAIVPGNPDASLLIQAIRHAANAPKMPMGCRGCRNRRLRRWRSGSATAPHGRNRQDPPPRRPCHASPPDKPITAEQRAFWSFRPIARVSPPEVATARLGEDRYRSVHPRAPREGRADAGPARRPAHADPPRHARSHRPRHRHRKTSTRSRKTPRRTRSPRSSIGCSRRRTTAKRGAASGSTSRATRKTIRAASIRIGRGYAPYPNAYLYRDWVIKAFNDDLPYDQFVKAQIAGDLLDEQTQRDRRCRRSGSSASAPGTTTTARSRSRAPTSATIASTSSRAGSSA